MSIVLNFTIQPATISDVSEFSKIQEAAYRADQVSHLMTLDRPEGWSYIDWLRRTNEHSFQDHSITFAKAVENSTGRTLGWACWAIKDACARTGQESDRTKSESESNVASLTRSEGGKFGNTTLTPSLPSKLGRQKLSELIALDSITQYTTHMSSKAKKHLILQGIFVLPTAQGCGIGRALIAHCTQEADCENLSFWVHASPASQRLYATAGFREVARKEFNLADFVSRGSEEGWGIYVFRYMVREAEL